MLNYTFLSEIAVRFCNTPLEVYFRLFWDLCESLAVFRSINSTYRKAVEAVYYNHVLLQLLGRIRAESKLTDRYLNTRILLSPLALTKPLPYPLLTSVLYSSPSSSSCGRLALRVYSVVEGGVDRVVTSGLNRSSYRKSALIV